MGNVRSTARGNDVVVDDDDKTEEEEEDKEEGDVVVPTANGVARVQRTPSISPAVVPRRLSQRPGCTITLKNIGCKIVCKTSTRERRVTRGVFPFDEPDEEIGAFPPSARTSEGEEGSAATVRAGGEYARGAGHGPDHSAGGAVRDG